MKQALTIVLCSLAIALTAQPINSDQVNYIISIQNNAGQPLQNQEVIAKNSNQSDELQTKFTTSKGKVKFVLKRGQTYKITYLNESFEAKIPASGTSFMTKKIIYKGTLTVDAPMAFDTVTLSSVPTKPTETEALFQLILKNKKKEPWKNLDVFLVQSTIKKVYRGRTNSKGQVIFLLPIGYDYMVNFPKDANYKKITVPKMAYLKQRKGFLYTSNFMNINETEQNDTVFQNVPLTQEPTPSRALIHVTVLDLDDQPLEDENVYLQGIKKIYTAKTDKDGKAALMIPKDGYYAVNFEYRDSLEVLHFEKGNYTRKDKISYKYIGSKAIKHRILERAHYEALWDSLSKVRAFRDSLAASRSDFSGFAYKIDRMPQLNWVELVQKRMEEDLKNIEKDPTYFEKVGDDIAAAMYRNRDRWNDKIIVTDLTCSMHPYLDQILSWHVLEANLKKDEKFQNQYMFFNDGNGKSMAEKIVGKTGGFHYSDAATLEALNNTMRKTMSTGCSIDGPENDMEALINAIHHRRSHKMEVILIADNNSDIRDFELLKYLRVPVRIILAGSDWGVGVNEQYLELAYQTKGSIHTLEQDLENLFELSDGEYIKVGDYEYRVNNGKFLKIQRM